MLDFVNLLKKTDLFANIADDEIELLLDCLDAKVTTYRKNQYIWMQGDANYNVGIVLTGQVNIIKEDVSGNRSLIASITAPNIFGESLVCSEIPVSPVTVQATENSKIMTIAFLTLIKTCESSCSFHTRLIQNMLKIIATKNLNLNKKLDHLSKKTTQQKLASYILDNLSTQNTLSASIPFNREELADYLGVNRSALSRELSKMRDVDIIHYKKNLFTISNLDALVALSNE